MSRLPRVVSATPKLAERAREERRARRTSSLRRLTRVLLAVAPLALLAWLVLASPWLVVDRVVVQGRHRLTEAQVLQAAAVERGMPLARVDTDAVAARVRALGPVASVSVHRAWPRTLRLTVVERVPVAGIPQGKAFVLVDRAGVVVARAGVLPRGVVRLSVSHPGPDDEATASALTVLEGLPKRLRELVAAVRAPSAEHVTLVLKDRRLVLWGGPSDAAAKADVLVPLLKMKGQVFDVSSPDVVTRR